MPTFQNASILFGFRSEGYRSSWRGKSIYAGCSRGTYLVWTSFLFVHLDLIDEVAVIPELEFMNRTLFSARTGRLSLWLSGAALAFGIFVHITRELLEGEVGAMDRAILLAVTKKRTPWLTIAAADVTALGSITLVVLFSAFTLLVLLVLRDRMGALQLLAASAGASVLTIGTKDIIERVRPAEALRLIAVSGFSYPSGHSLSTAALYLTIAIITGGYVQHAGARAVMFLAVWTVVMMIGASRVYLGVHYATDVVSGLSLGAAWALALAGVFTLFGHRASS